MMYHEDFATAFQNYIFVSFTTHEMYEYDFTKSIYIYIFIYLFIYYYDDFFLSDLPFFSFKMERSLRVNREINSFQSFEMKCIILVRQ